MTNREWLNKLNNKAMAAELLPPDGKCEYCIINEICDHITGICINKLVEWLQQEHIEPMPELKAGDIVDTNTGLSYVAINPMTLVSRGQRKQYNLEDITKKITNWNYKENYKNTTVWWGLLSDYLES